MDNTVDTKNRRYDLDWLRVIAIAILIIFHIMVMFQSYANQIRFIKSPVLLEILLIPLAFFSVIRIPLLFFISGMGAFYSLRRRSWLQFLGERTLRILVPLVFGSFAIVPIHKYIYSLYYSENLTYTPDMSHLWFLYNIYMYILWFLALFIFVKEITNSRYFDFLRRALKKYPFCIYLFAVPYVLQALTIPSNIPYTLYFDNRVGLLLGGVAFLLGFTFVAIGTPFWKAINKTMYFSLGIALAMFLIRLIIPEYHSPHIVKAVESVFWIFAIFGLGQKYLQKPGRILRYSGQAAYPFYIIHMVYFYLGAYIIFPLEINTWIKFLFIIIFTFTCCFITFEIIKRIIILKPLFGMRIRE